jgi:hypothetical protein
MPSSPSYFVVMIDYGRKGREAIVDPEMTRRGAVEAVREVLVDGRNGIAFIHHIAGGTVSDVTGDLIAEAGVEPVAA